MSRWQRRIAYMTAVMELLESLPLEYMSYQAIADALEAQGHPSPTGEPSWYPNSVRRLLLATGYEHLVAQRYQGSKLPPYPTSDPDPKPSSVTDP